MSSSDSSDSSFFSSFFSSAERQTCKCQTTCNAQSFQVISDSDKVFYQWSGSPYFSNLVKGNEEEMLYDQIHNKKISLTSDIQTTNEKQITHTSKRIVQENILLKCNASGKL